MQGVIDDERKPDKLGLSALGHGGHYRLMGGSKKKAHASETWSRFPMLVIASLMHDATCRTGLQARNVMQHEKIIDASRTEAFALQSPSL
jgi:hypothetical protein